ncbi:hypothetical protein [Paucibacter sp. M5-1]|uniref:hypothetical protein n=1 Tax=Paucibacter sp. M5-1 TaxID=3015998 RepID=UPI0022B9028A|nr:hypothetical protein [Paucibacter sp. M5-1]MCZ7881945.1 hypothetical protein [Paucibacter sp. M5-1]
MNRRSATTALMTLPLFASLPADALAAAAAPPRTAWSFRTSEGLDAIAFLGPLSGKAFYARYYAQELQDFKPRIAPAALDALTSLVEAADADGYLLWPRLSLILSGGRSDTIDDLLASLDDVGRRLRPRLEASVYWSPSLWGQFEPMVERLRLLLQGLKAAGFAAYRRGLIGPAEARAEELLRSFAPVDIISEQERLVGRTLEREIEMNLLWFCRPHGVKLQGQRFIAAVQASDATIALTAAHEVLHPPFDMRGAVARRCIAQLAADPLLQRILAEKSRDSGYNSIEGIFEEDTVQALDQIIQERLGYGQPPAQRWADSDEGMHVFAAALYGMLKADRFDQRGGNIEAWLDRAQARGQLAPAALHAAAAAVLGRAVDRLWTGGAAVAATSDRPQP